MTTQGDYLLSIAVRADSENWVRTWPKIVRCSCLRQSFVKMLEFRSVGMDKTIQRGDLKPYGALIKFVPAHWGKGKDLDRNTRSCWYRPGFRWSPEKAQSIVPQNLKGFKVHVLTSNA